MENSIEEDIILLKDFTEGNLKRDKLENYKGSYKMGYFYCKDIQQAIEHILSDYKRVSKENEQLRTEVNSLRKENEELKNKLNLKQFDVNIVYNDYLEKLDEYERNTIPIQRIKDKIEHYQKLQHNYIEKYDEINEGLQAMISALQELLGKE